MARTPRIKCYHSDPYRPLESRVACRIKLRDNATSLRPHQEDTASSKSAAHSNNERHDAQSVVNGDTASASKRRIQRQLTSKLHMIGTVEI